MGYPNLPVNTGPLITQDCDCIVTLPEQSTTSLRFNMTVTEGQNLVLKNVGTLNATYPSDNVAEESLTLVPGQTFVLNQSVIALCVKTNALVQVNLIVNGIGMAFSVSKMLFIDETLDSFTITNPTGTNATNANVALFYAIKPQ
jgi:hypothetical protein